MNGNLPVKQKIASREKRNCNLSGRSPASAAAITMPRTATYGQRNAIFA